MQIWKDSKYGFQEKTGEGGRGKAIWKISRLYRFFSIEGTLRNHGSRFIYILCKKCYFEQNIEREKISLDETKIISHLNWFPSFL